MFPFLGEIRIYAFPSAPKGWAFCDGQLLTINSNPALFSLLRTTYGGDGVSTFALPDLRGRMPLCHADKDMFTRGTSAGSATNTLLPTAIPPHNHPVTASSAPGNRSSGGNNFPAAARGHYAPSADTTLQSAVGNAGVAKPHDNMPPFLTLNFVIALTGIYPPRD